MERRAMIPKTPSRSSEGEEERRREITRRER
jgi:hypothetical protein